MNPTIPYLRQTMNETLRRSAGVSYIEFYPDGPKLQENHLKQVISPFDLVMVEYIRNNSWLSEEYIDYWEVMNAR